MKKNLIIAMLLIGVILVSLSVLVSAVKGCVSPGGGQVQCVSCKSESSCTGTGCTWTGGGTCEDKPTPTPVAPGNEITDSRTSSGTSTGTTRTSTTSSSSSAKKSSYCPSGGRWDRLIAEDGGYCCRKIENTRSLFRGRFLGQLFE